jgi:release factor glutamine methyltransferase
MAVGHNRLRGRSDTPALDIQVLLANVLSQPRAWVLAHPETELDPTQSERIESELRRLENGEPLPYILGHWEFYGLDLLVTPDVLIPRPETELLVERSLAWLNSLQPGKSRLAWIADIGTGSGCIAIALAKEVLERAPGRLLAVDISMPALQVAQSNAHRHNLADKITFLQADLLTPFGPAGRVGIPVSQAQPSNQAAGSAAGPFDLICANLPYIPRADLPGLAVARHEPRLALDGGSDGLDLIRRLLHMARQNLAPQAAMGLEIEASQGRAALAFATACFPYAEVVLIPDLAGHDRLLWIAT